MQTPDLTTFMVLHHGMRADSGRLAKALTEVGEPDRARRSRQLIRWYDGFLHELHGHHEVEDQIFFPALLERVPVFDNQIARIDADHALLDDVLDRGRQALVSLGDPSVSWTEASRVGVETTRELHALLERHLGFEDAEVLPMFVECFSAEDYEDLEERALEQFDRGTLPFALPWIMDNADPQQKQMLFDGAPFAFKVLWYATRGRYRRMATAAFGDVRAAEDEKVA
jgi:hemerythrin-like domain-containing protein